MKNFIIFAARSLKYLSVSIAAIAVLSACSAVNQALRYEYKLVRHTKVDSNSEFRITNDLTSNYQNQKQNDSQN